MSEIAKRKPVDLDTDVNEVFWGTSKGLIEQFKATCRLQSPIDRAERLAPLYIKWGKAFQIRADFAWAQAEHETGHLTFTGDVSPEQNNFSGIGATGGVPGNSFKTEELGVIAQYAHGAWYAKKKHWPLRDQEGDLYCSAKYDPRHFDYFDPNGHRYRGGAIKSFSEAWAVGAGGYKYSEAIIRLMNQFDFGDYIEPKPGNYFDIIIQMGHVGRTSGATGAAGEIAFTQSLGDAMVALLKKENPVFSYRIMGADNWVSPQPNLCKVFFSLHADGNNNPSVGGFSLGYKPGSDPEFAHFIAESYRQLAIPPISRQLRDNYTSGLVNYYAWTLNDKRRIHRVIADYYCLLEHGFMSNPVERAWMNSSIDKIAKHHVNRIVEWFSK